MIKTMSQKTINNFDSHKTGNDDTDDDRKEDTHDVDEEISGKMNKNDLKCNEKLIDVNKNIKDETDDDDEEDDDDDNDDDGDGDEKISSKNNKLIIDDDVICCDSDNDIPSSNGTKFIAKDIQSDNIGYKKSAVEDDFAQMEKDRKQIKEIMRAFRVKFNSLDGGGGGGNKECKKEFVCDDNTNNDVIKTKTEIGINGNNSILNNNMNNGNNNISSSSSNCNLNSSSTKMNNINNDNNDTVQDQTQFNQQTSFSMNKNEEFKFKRPPECPVFKPNEEEFKNPLTYISKVRSIAEKYGICKIIPPKTWTPPFTVDVDKLRFTPRVQRLNELEAKTRIKLNFLDQIAKFWELQGSSLKIPMVERKALDLYTLHRVVQEEGGMEQITKERKWSKIALRMHYPPGKSVGTILKGHYERILHPFDIFTSGKASVDLKLEPEINDKDYKPHGIVSRQQITPPNETTARRSKRFANSTVYRENGCGFVDHTTNSITIKNEIKKENNDNDHDSNDHDNNDDIKPSYIDCRRKFMYNNGQQNNNTTTMGCKSRYRSCSNNNNNVNNNNNNNNGKKKRKIKDVDPFAKYICHICNRGDAEEAMLLCDGCDDSYHTFCLIPPLNDIPKGDWRCPKCVVEEVSKPVEAFGFEQAQREYTLQQFGEMADQFKADYFNMAVHLVPTTLVEREFWRIVSSIDEDVTVEYGADLHTMDHGSGFPTRSSLYLLPDDQEYAESSWNLNNLPLLEESILGHINADISGMKVPWMYVGMCFATFCWHNEDHWSYSINYLHWGEPKTWYGVPGSKAEMFEETMKSAAPELFQSQPDLLHQLVTIMNPNILMNSGVPVYRTDQHAGEFVITFPRAYHAGFNQGYNFAEAVNFAPADWMKMGRECINHYSTLRRFCVFSHDELVCKMALEPDKLNLGIATACYLDMVEMVDTEKKLRKSLLDWGVTRAEREAFELIPDDERQCESCKTTCFLSAVACSCTKSIVCLRHNTELCSCPPEKHTLKYRYTLDELPLMLKKLKVKAESFENWLSRVRDVLDPNTPTTITLDELQELAQEAEAKKFPSSVLLERLNSAVLEAEKCVTVIQQLDINKMRTRTRNSCESAKYKLTLEELDMFVQEIDNLCCIIPEGQSVRELQILGKEFLENSKTLLSQSINESDENELEQLITDSSSLCIELPQLKLLKERLKQVNWYNRIREYRDGDDKLPLIELQNLFKEGMDLPPTTILEKELYELNGIITMVEEWEINAKTCFESGTQRELPEIELLLESGENIQCELPSKGLLKDAVKKSKEWLQTVETLQSNENYPYFHTLENVVNKGKNIPFELEELTRMEVHLMSARNWKDNTSRTFLKKHSTLTLMDVLSPRSDAIMINSKIKKKLLEEQFTEDTGPAQMVIAFKNAEEKELRDMRELRKLNMDKNPIDDKYCICKRKFQANMYHCQLCKDWFHTTCVPPPRLQSVRSRGGQQINNNSSSASATGTATATTAANCNNRDKDMDIKYLCQSCMRSRRPRLETILSLLVTLQSLPIRLPEGEALQCLTERAMNWQDRVRQAFSIEDISAALAILSTLSSNGGGNNVNNTNTNDNNTGNKNDKTNNNNKKSNRKSRLTAKVADIDFENDATTSSDDDDNNKNNSISSLSLPTKIEHAYSVPSFNNNSPITTGTKGLNNSSSINKDGNYIILTKSNKELLEDLMMEGDLLEVSLDETSHLWRILCATKPSPADLVHINYRYSLINPSTDSLVNTTKKRRSEDNASASVPSKRTTKNNLTPASDTNETIINSVTKIRRGRKLKMDTKSNENTPSDNKRRKRGKKTKDKQSVAVASNSDDDEECSAANCERPAGREVDWVQCDGGCNKWFHMYCVGLDKHQIKPDDDYICKTCKSRIESVALANNNKRNSRTTLIGGGGGGGGGEKSNNYNLICDDIDANSNEDGGVGDGDESGEGITTTTTTTITTRTATTTNPVGIDDDEDGNDDGDGDSNDGTTTNSNNKQNDDNKTSISASSPSRKLTLSDDNSAMPSTDVKSTSDLSNLSDKNLTTNTGELLLFKNDDKNTNISSATTTTTTTNQNKNDNSNNNSECSNFSNNNSNFNENNNSNSSSSTSCVRNKNFNSDSNNSTKSN